ncbi:restriction endonuclease subunit S [Bacillus sp. UNCCL81]|uniref:restriction endonuclease subunit S n=1 Tax=Bacillus sp. UNCCL81 TaxID=1502755 RepID=UPI0008DF5447|nr:restriction endonuclease subunit S [Bacillus sp. UNCCL81]SFD44358.1 type I restriction enzyme, S subunit [Bacillus sp. UNCCL81]
MHGRDLKNSILQLAIQGKLVEQREEEGTAKELLEKIEAEKKRLIKEGKIKKEKKLSEIKENEVLFDIPESWQWTRISNIADMYTGNSIPKNVKENKYSKVKEGYDYIGTKDVGFDYKIDYDNGIKIPYEEEKFRNSFKDSILMCIEGGSAGRKIGILDKQVCFGNKLCSFNLIFGEPKFLYYYLQSPMFFQAFRDEMTGIIGGVSIAKLKSIVMPIPPLEEQKRIVEKIEELMTYVNQYDKAYSEVEELNKKFPEDMQKSILQYAIQSKLVEQLEEEGTAEELYQQIQEEKKNLIKEGKIKKNQVFSEITEEEIPFDIPENWKWVRLIDILLVKPTNGYSPKGVSYETKVKNLTLTATTSGTFNKTAYKYVDIEIKDDSLYWLKHNDLLIQRSNSREYVGTSCIYTGEDNEFIYPDLIMRMRVHPIILLEYIDYVLKAPFSRKYFKESASGTSESMPKINQNTVSNALIPLPPLEEQKRIVEKIEELLPFTKQLVK